MVPERGSGPRVPDPASRSAAPGSPHGRGALAFTDQGFRAATATRATAQGILGLADIGLARLSARGSQPGDPHLACSS